MDAVRRITATAPDGLVLAGAAFGEGPGLLFVYGAMMEQQAWSRLAAHLPGHTLYTYDRRGRGESVDTRSSSPASSLQSVANRRHPPSLTGGGSDARPPHDRLLPPIVQTEVDDLLAFANALPRPFDVFGHSSGALLALHAAVRGLAARRLVLYEPVLPAVREPKVPADLPGRILAHVAAGDPDAAMAAFMRDGMWLSEAEIERARGSERWQDQLRYVHTAAYDVTIARTYELEPDRLAALRLPVLLLAGSESPAWMLEGVRRFGEVLPSARIETLAGQGHTAMFSAPDLLAGHVESFLAE